MIEEPIESYNLLYGFYLMITLSCTFYVIYSWKKFEQHKRENLSNFWKVEWPKIFALIIVFSLWWFEGEYRFKASYEASAKKTLSNISDAWENGQKDEVIKALDGFALGNRPWERPEYESSDQY